MLDGVKSGVRHGSDKPQLCITGVIIYSLWESCLQENCHKPFHLEDGFTTSDRLGDR